VKLWTRLAGTSLADSANGIAVGSGDSIFVAGSMAGSFDGQTSAGGADLWVSKYDATGNRLWSRLLGTTGKDGANAIAVSGGAVYVAGVTASALPGSTAAGKTDIALARYDESGTLVWSRSFGSSADEAATGVAVDASGNVYVSGTTSGTLPGAVSAGGNDIFLAKFDPSGARLWVKQLGTSAADSGTGVAVGADGGIYVSGITAGPLGGTFVGATDAVLAKFDATGAVVWTRQLGSLAVDEGSAVATDGVSVFLAGRSAGQLPGANAAGLLNNFVASYDFAGNLQAIREYSGGNGSGSTLGTSVAATTGRVLVGGATTAGSFDGTALIGGLDGILLSLCSGHGFACERAGSCSVSHGGCTATQACTPDVSGFVLCGCPSGSSGSVACWDVNECLVNNGGCDSRTSCTNIVGGRTCGACPAGFNGTGDTGCVDVNECATNNGGCDPHASCTNTTGSFSCGACQSGFSGSNATGCVDVDECAATPCDPVTTCTNSIGSFNCSACPAGYTGSGLTGCVDVDECAAHFCDALTTCTNTPGSFTCGSCPSGYEGTGATGCVDINECATNNGGCAAYLTCTNTVGSRSCGCPSGQVDLGYACVPAGPAWSARLGSTGTDQINGLAVDSTSSLIVAGFATATVDGQPTAGGQDAMVAKYSPAGVKLWSRLAGTSSVDQANGVAVGSADSLYVTGSVRGSLDGQAALGSSDLWVSRYDSAGSRLWSRLLGGAANDSGNAIAVRSGAVYVAGYSGGALPGSAAAGKNDIALARYDESGTLAWAKSFGSTQDDTATGVAIDPSGNVFLCGTTGGALPGAVAIGGKDIFISRYDASGVRQWITQMGTASDDSATAIVLGSDGGLYVSGITAGSLGGAGSGSTDAVLVKLDPAGAVVWTRQLGSAALDEGLGVTADVSGIFLTGRSLGQLPGANAAGALNLFAAKYDADGNRITVREFSGGNGSGTTLSTSAVAANGRLILAGASSATTFDGVATLGGTDGVLLDLCSGHNFACQLPGNCSTSHGGCTTSQTCTPDTTGFVLCGCGIGYTGSVFCSDVNECATGNGGCDALTSCANTVGSRTCGACPAGYSGTGSTGCVDINECATSNGGCDLLASCTNTPGSRTCGSCPAGYTGTGVTSCVDVDECLNANGGCDLLTSCTNTMGSHTCGACPTGYTGSGDLGCFDIDECATANGGCDLLTTCTNTPGSRVCGACPSGYAGTGDTACVDIDECQTNNGGCDPRSTCTNTAGSRVCGACPTGFTGDGETGCVDVDECLINNGDCDPLTTCTNTPGSRTCGLCPAGYDGSGLAGCVDIDECASGSGSCDPLTTCTNTIGSRTCSACPAGYLGDGASGCVDVNECATNNGGCDALSTCTNTAGSWSCGACPSGYTGTGATGCTDVNECLTNNGGCTSGSKCVNTGGSSSCVCYGGRASVNGTCADVDECATGANVCDPRASCTNTTGAYTCTCSTSGYAQDALPAARAAAVSIWDPVGQRMVVFGGAGGGGTPLSDFWSWDGARWTPISGATPPARSNAAFAWDGARSRLVVFGGIGASSSTLSDTWEWDGATWSQLTPAHSPGASKQQAATWDPVSGRVLVFGGRNGANTLRNDLWAWDGNDWTNITPASGSPSARAVAAMGYDFRLRQVVLFGGTTASGIIRDTWVWSGSAWTLRSANFNVAAMVGSVFVYDSDRQSLQLLTPLSTLVTGQIVSDWTGTTWQGSGVSLSGLISGSPAAAYDPRRHATIAFGGMTYDGTTPTTALQEWTPTGWVNRSSTGFSCPDINECATNNGGCDPLVACTNLPGTFSCGACPSGYTGTGATFCLDINECDTNNGGCDPRTTCTNTQGSRTCGVCPAGYSGTGATGCTDNDECATNNGGCDALTTCTNLAGSVACGACPPGYSGTGASGCVDVNECATSNGGCGSSVCTNTPGSYSCGDCPSGYTGSVATGCTDLNECVTNNGGCGTGTCTNTAGSHTCTCPSGYTGSGTTSCVDINECVINNGGCDPLTKCTNTLGSRTCGACPAGYTGTGTTGCVETNECTGVTPPTCQTGSKCANTVGSYQCVCLGGYNTVGNTCVDVNECNLLYSSCDATATCSNTTVGWSCTCPTGFNDTATKPVGRYSAASYFDPGLQKMVVFGGMATASTTLGDLWAWDGNLWNQLSASGPAARGKAAYAYDGNRHRFVMYGGTTNGTDFLGDTWEFDGQAWTQLSPAHSPSARSRSAAAWDPISGRVLMFGGTDSTGTHNDLWAWDGTDWSAVTPTGSTLAVNEPAMAYDPARQAILVFGGTIASGGAYIGGQALTGTTWTSLPTAGLPTGLRGSGMRFTWDPERKSLVLFGTVSNSFNPDLLGAWDYLSPSSGFRLIANGSNTARPFSTAAFIPARHTTALFGGSSSSLGTTTLNEFTGSGWLMNRTVPGGHVCADTNECATNNGGCDVRTTCTNTVGSRTCGACPAGYTGNGDSGCTDINECATKNGGCDLLTTCTNTSGSFSCGACPAGYSGTGATHCTDINECLNVPCGVGTCTNTAGSYTCSCPAEYTASGGTCAWTPCTVNNGGCDALTTCTNTPGGAQCGACPAGYSGTGATGCADVDECAAGPGSCAPGTCSNTVGSFVCSCPAGYSGGGTTACIDINECATNNGGCDLLTTCFNTAGSHFCGACPDGYTGDAASGCRALSGGHSSATAYQVDPGHAGAQSDLFIHPPLTRRWSVTLGGSISYPIVANGLVFVTYQNTGFATSALVALNELTGAIAWGPVALPTRWSNATYENGKVFVVDWNGLLRAYDAATGTPLWTLQLGNQFSVSAPPTVSNGVLYDSASGVGGNLYAVNVSTGTLKWTANAVNGDMCSPAVVNGTVFVSYAGQYVQAFNASTGAAVWTHTIGFEGGGGKNVAVSGNRLYARDSTGNAILDTATGVTLHSFTNGTIPAFHGTTAIQRQSSGVLGAFDSSTWAPLWTFSGDGHLVTAALVVNDFAYVGSSNGNLYAVRTDTGQALWQDALGVAMVAPDEQNVSQPLTGLGAGDGLLIVPAGSRLFAYSNANELP
jgi:outer membrane protein assembly factor BamB